MATRNEHGGWDISDAEAAQVAEASGWNEPLPGEAGSHAWMLDYLRGLGEEQALAGFGWTVSRGDKWATLTVSWQREGIDDPVRREWRMVPVDREERRQVDGSVDGRTA